MLHGLLWLPLLLIFVLLTALGWLERRRQNLFRNWASGSEICKLDSSGAAFLKDGELRWSAFEAGIFEEKDSFTIKKLELVELMALTSGEAPLTNESQGKCRLDSLGMGKRWMFHFQMQRELESGWINLWKKLDVICEG